MRGLLTAVALGVMGFGTTVLAQQSVVVVELYTSQGCSSCPAADKVLSEIAQDDHVLALSLHVDYWDYLGWKDKLARPEFTKRQELINARLKSRYRLVTPEMVFQGQNHIAGAHEAKAHEIIKSLSERPELADLTILRTDGGLKISLTPKSGQAIPSDLHVVEYRDAVPVEIERGENAGRNITYSNVVTHWDTVAQWDGETALELNHPVSSENNFAVIVQAENFGPVLVARQVK